jgi:regulator of protease activity HflC (stomatin/prohibitin superfamily)
MIPATSRMSGHGQEPLMNNGIIAAIVAAVAVVAGIVFGSWYTVDQTERGVLLRTGAVIGTAQPGLGFKVPAIDTVEKISVKTITYSWDKMNSYSYDQQPADLKISVTLRAAPEKVGELYAKFGSLQTAVNQVVSPAVNQQVKIVFGRYTAVKAIQDRGQLNSAIKDAITATLRDDPMIVIESVQLENIEFSANYLHSIEQRMLAEVEVQKLQQNAEREKVQAQITVTQANAKANAVRAEAQAAADALRLNGEARATNIRLTGEAEAAAIEARAKALGTNPNLVTLVQAERWNGVLPTTMVPGSAVPFVSVK